MIQFNLLPDIKLQYLKSRRQQHIVVLASVLGMIAALAVLGALLSTVYVLQKKNLHDLNNDIKTSSFKLQHTKDLTKVLTVQNQLDALTGLHEKKVVASRLTDYLGQVTPAQASIAKLETDFGLSTVTISGNADNLGTVNTYTDTLKFTTFKTDHQKVSKKAFSDVVLSSFSRDNKTTTYSITLKFDPTIFSNDETVQLIVPNIISSRSEVDKPTALFQGTGSQ